MGELMFVGVLSIVCGLFGSFFAFQFGEITSERKRFAQYGFPIGILLTWIAYGFIKLGIWSLSI
jgi:hypothetical protein